MHNPAAAFATDVLHARPLAPDEVPRLQALFDANPAYFRAVNGRDARPDEAQAEFDEMPPPHLGHRERHFLGVFDRSAVLVGVLVIVSDLCAEGVWHLTLFLLATALHGSGQAAALHDAMQAWAAAQGARWLRLVVVVGNARAERFWQGRGYLEVRQRGGIDTGGRVNDVRVMVKALGAEGLDAYLERVPRDRPESTLP